jgi:hypothetical protein
MKNRIIFGISAILALTLTALFAQAAGVCSLGLGTKEALYTGDTTTASFVNLYVPPTAGNVTLDLSLAPGISISSGANPHDNLAFGTIASWNLYISSAGTKTITATMINATDGTVVCSNTTTFRVVMYPNLTVSMSDLTTINVNEPANFLVTTNNLGPGNATNVSGVLLSGSGSAISPNTMTLSQLDAGASSSSTHSVTPTACGTGDSVSITVQYHDENGVLSSRLATTSDTFNIVGSDVAFTTVSATPATANAGDTITLSATVLNIGSTAAENVRVTFNVDGTAVSTQTIGNIAAGATGTATYAYTAGTGGSHNLTASVTADHECSSTNNAFPTNGQPPVTFTVTGSLPYCGDGTCNNGETCSSCSADCGTCGTTSGGGGGGGGGGRAGRIYILVLTPENPIKSLKLATGDTVKYTYNGAEYSFPFRYVFSDKAKMGVSTATTYKEYTLMENTKYNLNLDTEPASDLGITPSSLFLGSGNFTFQLLNIPEKKPIITLPFFKKKTVVPTELNQSTEVETTPAVVEPQEEELFSEGVLEFVESLNVKSTTPLWAGIAVALAIVLLGLGAYFLATRKRE